MTAGLVFARLLLALVFGVAGIAKFADRTGSKKSLADFGVPSFLVGPLSVLLPLLELSCAFALVPARSAWWGAIGVSVMLLFFTAAISLTLVRGRRPDCHCFGQLHSSPIGWKTVVRNLMLVAVAAFILWQQAKHPGLGFVDAFESLGSFDFGWLAFGAFAVFQLWFSFHLLRQNGRLILRVEALEAKQGPSPEPPPPGLPINIVAPQFSLSGLEGGVVTLPELIDEAESMLLTFVEPSCAVCDALLPELAQWQKEYDGRVSIVVVSQGSPKANRAKIGDLNLRNVLLQNERETAESYKVTATPSAVLVRNGEIASVLAEGIDPIRSLVRRAILPPPVKKGDPAPSLILADLTGKTVDLATLHGRRFLLLFWNPSCGFCQEMLEDVKSWESAQRDDSTELLVISSGSFEANRVQGFRSRVLLDPYSGASHVFGAEGTPSAVVIDENGKVASEVGGGSDEVWALAKTHRGATA